METILVTGATGNVGAEVVRLLRDHSYDVRAGVRTLPDGPAPMQNLHYVPLDFAQPQSFGPALKGVTKVFLMRPPAISDTKTTFQPFLAAARAAGVEHVVFLSLMGVEKNPFVPHRALEDAIRVAQIPATFLRASFFMQNLSTTHRHDILDRDEIFVPAGKGKTSFIDVRDIAAVAVKTLTEPGHAHKAYPLTGAVALDYYEVASLFSEVLGRPIVYRAPSLLGFMRQMYARGVPLGFLTVMAAIYATARLGLAAGVTPDTERILGRSPISMREFVQDYRACWLKTIA